MGKSLRHDIRVFDAIEEMSRAAALSLIDQIRQTLIQKTLFSLVLSGGQTPRCLYRFLATEFRRMVPWTRMRLYMGDERFVPPGDPRSNYRMIKEAMLDSLPILEKNVFPMPTGLYTPEQAAISYENILRSHYDDPWPRFDAILLGMGTDGHIASLFPSEPALTETEKWVVVSRAPDEPRTRLTMTLPVINNAQKIYFLITGKDKARAFKFSLGERSPNYPASMVRPVHGRLSWWVDEAASVMMGK
jgi:6-phosphogluconolactonase